MLSTIAQWMDTIPTHLRQKRTLQGPAASSCSGIRFVDLGSTWVRLRQQGNNGPSLVLATDPPVPLELYDGLLAALSVHFRVTVFECPGFGASLPRFGTRISMPSMQQTVAALLERLPGAPHILAMPCMTGYVALALARQHPELIRQLVLSQTPAWPDARRWLDRRDPQSVLRKPIVGQLLLHQLRRKRIRQWYAGALADKSRVDEFASATLTNFDHGGCFCLASAFQDFMSHAGEGLAPAEQETLLLWGNADPSHPHVDFPAMQQLAVRSHLVRLDQTGHFPELEATEAFVTQIRSFAAAAPTKRRS